MGPYLIIAITLAVIVPPYFYFRKQKNICFQYPFYKLRNDIFIDLATNGKSEDNLILYKIVNDVINRLDILNFNFFVDVNVEYIKGMVENQINGTQSIKKSDLNLFQKRFFAMIVKSARKNSFLLRIAMNKYCRLILVLPVVFRFIKKHPSLYNKFKPEIETMKDYSKYSKGNPAKLATT